MDRVAACASPADRRCDRSYGMTLYALTCSRLIEPRNNARRLRYRTLIGQPLAVRSQHCEHCSPTNPPAASAKRALSDPRRPKAIHPRRLPGMPPMAQDATLTIGSSLFITRCFLQLNSCLTYCISKHSKLAKSSTRILTTLKYPRYIRPPFDRLRGDFFQRAYVGCRHHPNRACRCQLRRTIRTRRESTYLKFGIEPPAYRNLMTIHTSLILKNRLPGRCGNFGLF